MARIRSVHPGLFSDEAFVSVGMQARVLLIGIWTESDDAGIFEWKPNRFKMRIFPGDDADVKTLLAELSQYNLVTKFSADGKELGAVRNFCKWQRPRQPVYLYPRDGMEDYVGLDVGQGRSETERGAALGKILVERQGNCCAYCGNGITAYRKKINSLHIDHAIPIARGGTDDIGNLVAACKPCNLAKGSMIPEEFRAKFAPSELLRMSVSQIGQHIRNGEDIANVASHGAKEVSQAANVTLPMQRKEGGGRRKEVIDKHHTAASVSASHAADAALRKRLVDAIGNAFVSERGVEDLKPILEVMGHGADLEADVLPVAREFAARGPLLSTWKPVAMAIAERMSAKAQAKPFNPDDFKTQEWDLSIASYRKFTDEATKAGKPVPNFAWSEKLGPKPDEPGCKAPSDVLIRHGFAGANA